MRVGADGSQAREEIGGVAAAAERGAQAVSAAYARVAVSVRAASQAVGTFRQALGLWANVATIAGNAIRIVDKGVELFRNFGRASDEAGEKARAAFRAASDAGLDASLYDAVKAAADRAGVSADEFSRKLAAFRDHKVTFDELARSIGSTGRALEAVASWADPGTVGTRFLAAEKDRADADRAWNSARDLEREGLRTIANRIVRDGDAFGRGADVAPLWDMIMEAAGGDRARAGEIFNENVSWYSMRRVGQRMFGDEALGDAEGRYAARRAELEAARVAEVAAHDARVLADRKAKADEEAAKAAEKEADARKRAAVELARAFAAASKASADAEARLAGARKAREEAGMSTGEIYERRAQELDDAKRAAARVPAGGDPLSRAAAAGASLRVVEAEKALDAAAKAFQAEVERGAGAARDKAGAVASIRVSAPSAANALAQSGALLGGDAAAAERARMDAERNAALRAIEQRFERLFTKFDEQREALLGE